METIGGEIKPSTASGKWGFIERLGEKVFYYSGLEYLSRQYDRDQRIRANTFRDADIYPMYYTAILRPDLALKMWDDRMNTLVTFPFVAGYRMLIQTKIDAMKFVYGKAKNIVRATIRPFRRSRRRNN